MVFSFCGLVGAAAYPRMPNITILILYIFSATFFESEFVTKIVDIFELPIKNVLSRYVLIYTFLFTMLFCNYMPSISYTELLNTFVAVYWTHWSHVNPGVLLFFQRANIALWLLCFSIEHDALWLQFGLNQCWLVAGLLHIPNDAIVIIFKKIPRYLQGITWNNSYVRYIVLASMMDHILVHTY